MASELESESRSTGGQWAIVAALVGLVLVLWASERATRPLEHGRAPDFSLPVVGQVDQHVRLSDLRGKVVALVFWSDRGTGVKQALRFWRGMHEKHAEHGLVVLGLALDRDEAATAMLVRRLVLKFTHVYVDRATLDAYQVNGVPAAIVVDRDGMVRMDYRGWHNTAPGQLTDGVEQWLAKKAAGTQPDGHVGR